MPGSVQNAAPASVLPASLSRVFARKQDYAAMENEYRNGESQRSVQSSNSRKRWTLGKRLTPAQLDTLRTFYDARSGPVEPFYFYDPYEADPKFTSDPTGVATAGRYTVRFDCGWNQSCGPGRTAVQIELTELA